jgi:uncharacterized protein YbjT (DUF2867 family)
MNTIIIGASGLTGSFLLQRLIDNPEVKQILSFARRNSGESSLKLKEHIIDFDKPEQWKELVRGDVLFSCLGTTLKRAGGKQQQYKVDYSYQFEFAKAAAENGVPTYILVSSTGANAKSAFFYMRMKGQLEDSVKELQFQNLHILRPNILDGERKEKRTKEKIALKIIKFFNKMRMFKKARPTHADELSKEMIQLAKKYQTIM